MKILASPSPTTSNISGKPKVMPRMCGIVAGNPKLTPELATMMLLGPGKSHGREERHAGQFVSQGKRGLRGERSIRTVNFVQGARRLREYCWPSDIFRVRRVRVRGQAPSESTLQRRRARATGRGRQSAAIPFAVTAV